MPQLPANFQQRVWREIRQRASAKPLWREALEQAAGIWMQPRVAVGWLAAAIVIAAIMTSSMLAPMRGRNDYLGIAAFSVRAPQLPSTLIKL